MRLCSKTNTQNPPSSHLSVGTYLPQEPLVLFPTSTGCFPSLLLFSCHPGRTFYVLLLRSCRFPDLKSLGELLKCKSSHAILGINSSGGLSWQLLSTSPSTIHTTVSLGHLSDNELFPLAVLPVVTTTYVSCSVRYIHVL